MKKNYRFLEILTLFTLLFWGNITTNAQGDNADAKPKISYSVLPDPAGFTQNTEPLAPSNKSINGLTAYGNNVFDMDFYSFDIENPLSWSMIANVDFLSLSGDFSSEDPDHIWIIDNVDSYLKKIAVSTAAVIDSVAMPCPLANGIWTCISFHKTTGQLFAIATSTISPDSRFYEVERSTGIATELFELGAVVMISGTFDMNGDFYGFDLFQDSIYTINVSGHSKSLLGYSGFDGNFAQGMGCDPETNEVYLAAMHNGVGAELRSLNKGTGATTLISTLPGETTAFGFPVTNPPQAYSITGVYTDETIENGDTIWVAGYCTDTVNDLMIEFYGNWDIDEAFAPQTTLVLDGNEPPAEAWNGGYIFVRGIASFVANPQPYHPEDSLIAHIDVFDMYVLYDGEGAKNYSPGKSKEKVYDGNGKTADCDSCKFAVLISGGINEGKNHSKYWENLVALYNFKVDSLGYCKDNVFVHYYQGTRRDNRIPQDRVFEADSTKITDSFTEISERVAKCSDENKMSTLQKMVSNHGKSNGDINLLDRKTLKPAHLRDMQQKIIDSCCSLVYDEFLQCYGGYSVDTMKTLNPRNKAKIYANSNANHVTGHSPHNEVHPYLKGKIDALDEGKDYEDAVIAGKMGYDAYLQGRINIAHQNAQWYRNRPWRDDAAAGIARWVADSTMRANKICTSRNISITPMKEYCQWEKFVVPAGGQLVLEFKGDNKHCGNITIYWVDPVTGAVKYKVFNWNVEGSVGYSGNNKRRVVNGGETGPTTFWVHNDDGTFQVTSSSNGNQDLQEDVANTYEYPGTSFGGDDDSSDEFGFLTDPSIWIENIDQVPFALNSLPSYMGVGYTNSLGGSLTIDPTDIYASEMELHLDIVDVYQPGVLNINSSGSLGMVPVFINGPGKYDIPLGDFTLEGPYGFIEMSTSDATFSIDCWGVHSSYEPLLIDCNMFLEGPFADGVMNTDLNPSLIPLSQPFNTSPWNYPGNESVGSIPNADVVDWVLLELRDTTNASLATDETTIAQNAAFILSDGSIVGLDGNRSYAVPFAIPSISNNLYVVIWQRNHLGIMSANPLSESDGRYVYDFTTGNNQAHGTGAQKDLGAGIFGMIGGDSNADGFINEFDKLEVWDFETGEAGYLNGDVNMDGQANNEDKNDLWLENEGGESQVPE